VALTALLRRFLLEVDDDGPEVDDDGLEVDDDDDTDLGEDVPVGLADDDELADGTSPYLSGEDPGALPGTPYYIAGQQ
jgi:hypothetical protein